MFDNSFRDVRLRMELRNDGNSPLNRLYPKFNSHGGHVTLANSGGI